MRGNFEGAPNIEGAESQLDGKELSRLIDPLNSMISVLSWRNSEGLDELLSEDTLHLLQSASRELEELGNKDQVDPQQLDDIVLGLSRAIGDFGQVYGQGFRDDYESLQSLKIRIRDTIEAAGSLAGQLNATGNDRYADAVSHISGLITCLDNAYGLVIQRVSVFDNLSQY